MSVTNSIKFQIKDQPDDSDFHISQLQKIKTLKENISKIINPLKEFKEVDQKEKNQGIIRRWFQNEVYTLIVWYDLNTNEIIGFQLCYGQIGSDKAITWYNEKEFSHKNIDYGKMTNITPVLDQDLGLVEKEIFDDFYKYSENIDTTILDYIKKRVLIILEKRQETNN